MSLNQDGNIVVSGDNPDDLRDQQATILQGLLNHVRNKEIDIGAANDSGSFIINLSGQNEKEKLYAKIIGYFNSYASDFSNNNLNQDMILEIESDLPTSKYLIPQVPSIVDLPLRFSEKSGSGIHNKKKDKHDLIKDMSLELQGDKSNIEPDDEEVENITQPTDKQSEHLKKQSQRESKLQKQQSIIGEESRTQPQDNLPIATTIFNSLKEKIDTNFKADDVHYENTIDADDKKIGFNVITKQGPVVKASGLRFEFKIFGEGLSKKLVSGALDSISEANPQQKWKVHCHSETSAELFITKLGLENIKFNPDCACREYLETKYGDKIRFSSSEPNYHNRIKLR